MLSTIILINVKVSISIKRGFYEFKISISYCAVIAAINALGLLFMPTTFFEMANLAVSPEVITLGQFIGVTILFIAILQWRIPDIAGDALSSLGQLFGIGNVLWALIVIYHIMTGQAGGTTGYANVLIFVVLAVLFFMQSRKSE